MVKGNILDHATMEQTLQGCDAVVYIALGWENSPLEMLKNDTEVTVFLAEKVGVKNFIYTSSTAVYGRWFNGMDEDARTRMTCTARPSRPRRSIARWAIEMTPGIKTKIIYPAGEMKHELDMVNVDKIKRVFGLSFDATANLREHLRWNLDREARVLAREVVHNVYHVW